MNAEANPPFIPLGLWLKRVFSWLKEAWPFWLAIGFPGISLCLLYYCGVSERSVRFCGLFHQTIGISTVALGLYQTRKLFDKPSIMEKIFSWVKKYPNIKSKNYDLNGSEHIKAGSSGSITVIRKPQNDNIEERLRAAEENIVSLREDIEKVDRESMSNIKEIRVALESEKHKREFEDQALKMKVEESSVGGLNISSMGTLWLLIGAIMSTIAPELEKMLR
jgi:hypothetical protein